MLVSSAVITGLGLGSMYGLLALGFHVTYAVSNTVNFAQGGTMMLGAVLSFTLSVTAGVRARFAGRLRLPPPPRRCRPPRRLGLLERARRARRSAPLRATRIELLVDGDGGSRHRARECRPLRFRTRS